LGVAIRDVTMPGQVWGLAAADPAGAICVTSYASRSGTTKDLYNTVLTVVDLTGALIWQHGFRGRPYPPCVDPDGTMWIAHTDGGEQPVVTLSGLGANGRVLRSVIPEHQYPEHLGAFVRMPDGFCVLWLPAPPAHVIDDGAARLARYDDNGDTLWSSPLPLISVSFAGVVEVNERTGWHKRPAKPYTLAVDSCQPLLVAGDRVLAALHDYGSGIGICAIADAATGDIISTTQPQPYGHKAIAGRGRFLVGVQGYGTFSSSLHDRQGLAVQTWPSHGMMLIGDDGEICGPESDNSSRTQRFRVLAPDGSMRDGPLLSGYYTTYPALDVNGTAVFWRDGALAAIDADLHGHELFTGDNERSVLSRVLLMERGSVVFAAADQLLIARNTGLGPLAAGPWPCEGGNIRGNPVLPA
jgi:hypothetical protein